MNLQVSGNANGLALGVIDTIDAVGLIPDKVSAKCLVLQLLASRFLGNVTVDERSELAYVTNTRLRAVPCFVWRLAI